MEQGRKPLAVRLIARAASGSLSELSALRARMCVVCARDSPLLLLLLDREYVQYAIRQVHVQSSHVVHARLPVRTDGRLTGKCCILLIFPHVFVFRRPGRRCHPHGCCCATRFFLVFACLNERLRNRCACAHWAITGRLFAALSLGGVCSRPLRACVVAFASLPSPPKATSDDGERAKNIGRLTAAYTVGAALGPALGGYLGWELSAQFAIVGSFLSAVLVLAFPLQPAVSALRAARCRLCCAARVCPSCGSVGAAHESHRAGPPLLAAPQFRCREKCWLRL